MLLTVSFCFLAVLLGSELAEGQQRNGGSCSRDRMRQCEEGLRRNTQRRITDLQRVEMSAHCVNVRDDFNCLLKETRCLSTESERNRNGDTLRSGLKYIRDGCDSAGGSWRDSSCYIGDGMKNCESSYPLGGVQYASYNPETCRKYNLFFDCVMDNIRSRCRPEDDMLLGQYLVDSGQDLAWNCGDRDTDRSRDDRYSTDRRYGNNDRDNDNFNRGGGTYNRESDRYPDRDRDRYPSGGQYGGNGYGRNDYVGSDITCCRNERCDRNRQSQCKDSLSRSIDSRMTGNLDRQRCRKVRDDFNCLMWQTSHCTSREDRDRDNDIFRRARDFISRQCDTYDRWTDNSCYKTTEMQRCESQLTNTRGGANYEACRSFLTFRDCMTEEIQRRCTRDDDLFQGAYMVDKAQEMSWQCGGSGNGGSGNQYNDRDRNGDRGQSGDRNPYSTFDRRDQYDRQDGYDANPIHLEDEDSNCAARIRTYSDACKTTMDNKRREFYSENDYDRKQKINCCSVREYRNCLYDVTRRYCQGEKSRVVDNLMAGFRHHLTSDSCSRIYDSECSSSCKNQLSMVLLTICVALLSALFSFRR